MCEHCIYKFGENNVHIIFFMKVWTYMNERKKYKCIWIDHSSVTTVKLVRYYLSTVSRLMLLRKMGRLVEMYQRYFHLFSYVSSSLVIGLELQI